jgi:hypothetical protein
LTLIFSPGEESQRDLDSWQSLQPRATIAEMEAAVEERIDGSLTLLTMSGEYDTLLNTERPCLYLPVAEVAR